MMLSGKKLIAVSMVFFIFFCPVFAQDQESSIGFDKAEEIALEESGGGTVVKSKMDRDDRMFMYEITVVNNNTRYEFEISVDDGAIYEYTESMIRTDRSRRETAADTSISREEAESIALEKTGGGRIHKTELDRDHGMTVYEVDIRDTNYTYEVEIDRSSGDIVVFNKKMRGK